MLVDKVRNTPCLSVFVCYVCVCVCGCGLVKEIWMSNTSQKIKYFGAQQTLVSMEPIRWVKMFTIALFLHVTSLLSTAKLLGTKP